MPATLDPAPRDAAASQIARLTPHLAPLTRQRLDKLLALVGTDHRIVYADAYAALFPDTAADPAAKTRADKSFGKLRDTLAAIAAEHGVTLGLKVDQRRNAKPADRRLWFVAEDDTEARIGRSADSATQGLPETQAEQYVAVRAETIEPFYLLVYAQEERDDAQALHDGVATHLKAGDCTWSMRDWHNPDAGVHIDTTRRAWLKDARLVLVLASPRLIANIKGGSIALETDRPLVVLALRAVSDDQVQGTPLAGLPIFDGLGAGVWTACRGPRRDGWVKDAAATVLELTRRPQPARDPFARLVRPHWDRFGDMPDDHYVHQHTATPGQPEGRVALDLLLEWLADPEGSVLCAVFGELGMGKTTLCQRLTRDLLKRRAAGESLPMPVYLDLRAVNTLPWDWGQGVPPLGTMLEHIVAKAYNLGVDEPRPSAEQIARLAQQGGGLILFDGLDEVMNRLTPEQNGLFIEQLWSVLPPILWKPPARLTPAEAKVWRRPAGVGRLLMTCRSHFFQTLQDQVNALIGQQREPIGRADYLWATLLPFTPGQVETYFRQVFADDPERAGRVIAMLDTVHDLKELGSRPYNLRLIQDQVDALEAIHREGRRVDIADLYEGLVGQWTRRDDPKHRLNRDHKLLLMERLALHLWSAQQANLPYQALNDWLVDQILANPRWERVEYRPYLDRTGGADILKEDLRNASFLVREGEDRFRFAHTSIQEFFLARALHRALVEDRLDQWAIPIPSPETLEFLGGLIAARDTDTCLVGLARIRTMYRPKASELVLAYALHAQGRDYPGADCTGFQLPGAELRFQRWQGREDSPLSWRGADLSDAQLHGGVFIDCDFADACFEGANLTGALFDRCRLERIAARGANLTGATVHECVVSGARLTGIRFHQTHWLGGSPLGSESSPPDVFLSNTGTPPPDARPGTILGHSGNVRHALCDPLGRWFITAGDERNVRIWDATSGRLLHCLGDNGGKVSALAVALDGAWIACAGEDATVRVWDPLSGCLLRRLEGHQGWIRTIAVAPDGCSLASAGDDHKVHLWDIASGRLLNRLEGHDGLVSSVAVAPDGLWLASAGEDIRLWDPGTGRLLRRMECHGGDSIALAVAPDGSWLASAWEDGIVRVWDTVSGRLLHRLEGQWRGVCALLVSPDGTWLASAGEGVRLWDSATGRLLSEWRDQASRICALAAAPDGTWLAFAGDGATVRLLDPASGRLLRALEGHSGSVSDLLAPPDGAWLASFGTEGSVQIWETERWRVRHRLEDRGARISALALAPDAAWLCCAADGQELQLWELASGRPLSQSLAGVVLGGVWALAVGPDGSWIASAGYDGIVRLWETASGSLMKQLWDHEDATIDGRSHRPVGRENGIRALAVAPDGSWIAAAGKDGIIRLWHPESGRLLRRLRANKDDIQSLAITPAAALIAVGLNRSLQLWDAERGQLLLWLEAYSRSSITAVAVAPDGSWLASASGDGSLMLVDAASQKLRHRLQAHPGAVRALAVAWDGGWLASAGSDGEVRLWDPASGRLIHRLKGHLGEIRALAVSRARGGLASAGDDGTVRYWTLPPRSETPGCELALELLPEGNWVAWQDPDGPNRRWVHWSRDAWRWLGWHAPLPDGKQWMFYPMDAFSPEPPANGSG